MKKETFAYIRGLCFARDLVNSARSIVGAGIAGESEEFCRGVVATLDGIELHLAERCEKAYDTGHPVPPGNTPEPSTTMMQ